MADLLLSYDFAKLSPRLQGSSVNLDATNLLDKRSISSCYAALWCWYVANRDVQVTMLYRW